MRVLVLASTFVGLAAVACWGASRPPGVAETATRPASPTPQTVGAPQTPPSPHEPLDLRAFTPLLAEPELLAVRAAADDEQPARAASLLLALPPASSELEQARRHFLAGVLLSAAGDAPRARQSFLEAARHDWILRADAWLRAAENFALEGHPTEALGAAQQAKFEAVEPRLLLVRARAHASLEQGAQASDGYQQLADGGASPEVQMEGVRLLVKRLQAATDQVERRELAQKGLVALRHALLGLSSKHPLATERKRMEDVLLPALDRAPAAPGLDEKLAHFSALLDQNALEEAREFSVTVELPSKEFTPERCEFDSLEGKLLALERRWGEAAEKLAAATVHCTADRALHAKLLFNAGKYAAADGRDARAVRYYADLERLYPESTLADDARLRAARSYKDMGAPARYVDLLTRLPEDYPRGDMTWEGVLELALYRVERKDWASAALILESGAAAALANDAERGQEFSGCERYFLARAHGELGKTGEELDEYQAIVEELPLSYYMLHAYSRLHEVDAARADKALRLGQEAASARPFSFPHRAEYESPSFRRGMELLRVSELEAGRAVLGRLGLGSDADQSLLWGLALLYDQAGDAHVSFGIAQGRLTDWFSHYPSGGWERPWQIGFPRPYYPIVQKESRETGVPEWFIYGIMREESTFDPGAESPAEAYGLMQLIVPTARVIGKKAGLPYTPQALKRPQVNIALGSRVLSSLTKQFPANPWLAIPGYNAGPGRPKRWLRDRPDMDFDVWVEMIPFRETRRYTKRVLASRATYAFLYQRDQAGPALLLPRRLAGP